MILQRLCAVAGSLTSGYIRMTSATMSAIIAAASSLMGWAPSFCRGGGRRWRWVVFGGCAYAERRRGRRARAVQARARRDPLAQIVAVHLRPASVVSNGSPHEGTLHRHGRRKARYNGPQIGAGSVAALAAGHDRFVAVRDLHDRAGPFRSVTSCGSNAASRSSRRVAVSRNAPTFSREPRMLCVPSNVGTSPCAIADRYE